VWGAYHPQRYEEVIQNLIAKPENRQMRAGVYGSIILKFQSVKCKALPNTVKNAALK
jgi:hypothetical protein